MYYFIILGWAAILISALLLGKRQSERYKDNLNNFTVCAPPAFRNVMLFSIVAVFVVLPLLNFYNGNQIPQRDSAYFLLEFFRFINITALVIINTGGKLQVQGDVLLYTSFFRMKRETTFQDIGRVLITTFGSYKVYTRDGNLFVTIKKGYMCVSNFHRRCEEEGIKIVE